MTQELDQNGRGVTKMKLALGAASLFLFIVGVKRSFRTEEGEEILQDEIDEAGEEEIYAHPPKQLRVTRR